MGQESPEGRDGIERERRYLVTGQAPEVKGLPYKNIQQSYLRSDPEESLRIRLILGDEGDLLQAILNSKCGSGEARPEKEQDLASPGAAQMLYDSSKYRVRKRRYHRDGWEVDFFHDSLNGLVLAEYERKEGENAPAPPDWLGKTMDVTDTVNNAMLAKLAYELEDAPLNEPLWKFLTWRIPRVVITGGPGSGKSGVIKALQANQTYSGFHFVPEVPTIIFQSVGRPGNEALYQNRFSRGIGNIQMDFEAIAEIHAKNVGHAALVMDRGLADGFAYNDQFERAMEMSRQAIYRRYDLIIYMSLPGETVWQTHKANNPARIETYPQAAQLSQRTFSAWEEHPNFIPVPAEGSWEGRVEQVGAALRGIFKPRQ